MKHRADGLYYATLDMLRKHSGACESGLGTTARALSLDDDTPVPLTLDAVENAQRTMDVHGYGATWRLATAMHNTGKITQREYDAWDSADDVAIDRGGPARMRSQARAFMNLLEKRAIREGKLPPRKK